MTWSRVLGESMGVPYIEGDILFVHRRSGLAKSSKNCLIKRVSSEFIALMCIRAIWRRISRDTMRVNVNRYRFSASLSSFFRSSAVKYDRRILIILFLVISWASKTGRFLLEKLGVMLPGDCDEHDVWPSSTISRPQGPNLLSNGIWFMATGCAVLLSVDNAVGQINASMMVVREEGYSDSSWANVMRCGR